MRKYITIFLIYILILSIINVIPLKPASLGDSITCSVIDIDNSIFNQAEKTHILQNLNKIDGFFTENRGQVGNDSVRYYIQGKGVWFLDDSVVFEIFDPVKTCSLDEKNKDLDPLNGFRDKLYKPIKRKSAVLKLNFEGANRVIPKGRGLLPHRSNFFYGNDSAKWCTNVFNYQEIFYKNLYDNIDLKYYTTINGLKYDFIVHPGANIRQIRIKYEGIKGLEIDQSGNLIIKMRFYALIDGELFIYQNCGSIQKQIMGKFVLFNNSEYGFKILQNYNKNEILIIDPLVYSTYIGDSNFDIGYDLEINALGELYLTGWTYSIKFPTTQGANDTSHNGFNDIFILKLDRNCSMPIYSTFIGGNSYDYGFGVAIDINGNAYATGYTDSANFPTTSGVNDIVYDGLGDVFILKLNQSGSKLIYSTFVNGTDWDYGYAITIDSIGNAFITGGTYSSDFTTTNGANDTNFNGLNDVFILKINQTGSKIIYSTYVGGIGWDKGYDIVIDTNGNAYVTGYTYSGNFPITSGANDTSYNGGYDAFILKLSNDSSTLIYSTYIGGDKDDFGTGIIIDSIGNAYVTGDTNSSNFPVTLNAYDSESNGEKDVFILKLNLEGNSLMYSTFIGGNNNESGLSITSDSLNNLYIYGKTNSSNFPTTLGAIDITYNGGSSDIFMLKFNLSNSLLLYSTYIGGSNAEHYDPFLYGSIKIDSSENIYITSFTNSINFPTTPNALDTSYNGKGDAFVLKINPILNKFPLVIDLKISKPKILRTNSVYLYSNASDIEDMEKNLTPYFEYRDSNEQLWNKTLFSNIEYNNSRWEVKFTPSKYSKLGLYDFRVRFKDTFGLISNWFYLNDALMVLNNIPVVENIFLSNNKALSGDKISLWINGTDVEEPERNLTIELEYRDSNEQVWDTINLNTPKFFNERWVYTFSIPFNAPFGYYDFRTRFNDSDKDFSQWLYKNDSLLIYNKRPSVIDIQLSDNYVSRTNSIFLFVNGTDYETPEHLLKLYAQFKHINGQNWIDITGNYSNLNQRWELEFLTNKNTTLGLYDFRVKFIDNASATTGWINYSSFGFNNTILSIKRYLEVLNNAPRFEDLNPLKSFVFRTETIIIYTNASDIEEPENLLRCVIQYKSSSGDWADVKDEFFNTDHWEINLTFSIDAELGYYDIRVNFTDLDNDFSDWTIIENAFEVRNNLPEISIQCDNFEVDFHTKDIDLTQYESDIEDSDKDLIWNIDQTTIDTNLFSMNIVDVLEDKIQIIPKDNVSGSDDITLTLIDKDKGLAIKSNVTIYVNSVISFYYDVNITVCPNSMEIIQGQSLNTTLVITNIGNLSDNFTILFESNNFPEQNIRIAKDLLSLKPTEFEKVNVTITASNNMKINTYKIKYKVKSNYTMNDTVLTINVKAKNDSVNKDDVTLFVGIWIIIIIILIIIIFLFIKRKKRFKQKKPPIVTNTHKPTSTVLEQILEKDLMLP